MVADRLSAIGPIPDILKRTAYVAAYDRRLRHPSWASRPHLSNATFQVANMRAVPNDRPLST